MPRFEPTNYGFVHLPDYQPQPGRLVYEHRVLSVVDGKPNFRRVNSYLSLEGDLTTIWFGVLRPEPDLVDRVAEIVGFFNMEVCYELLFEGNITNACQADRLFLDLRLDQFYREVLFEAQLMFGSSLEPYSTAK